MTDLPDRLTDRREIVESGCWEWRGFRDPKGYGRIQWQGRKSALVHRVAAHYALGLDLDDFSTNVCHRCDNPPCFNPEHLFLGTHRENMLDAQAKGRLHRIHPRFKTCLRCGQEYETLHGFGSVSKYCSPECYWILTADDVRAIKRELAVGKRGTGKKLAEEFGVAEQTICNIKHGRAWASVTP